MNNKGFSLVELLAVIALLAIILLIFTPNITKMIDKFRDEDKVEILKNNAISAAKEYVVDGLAEGKITATDIQCNNNIYIEVKNDLIDNKYLEDKESKKWYKEQHQIEVVYDSDNKKFIDYKYCMSVTKSEEPCSIKCEEN